MKRRIPAGAPGRPGSGGKRGAGKSRDAGAGRSAATGTSAKAPRSVPLKAGKAGRGNAAIVARGEVPEDGDERARNATPAGRKPGAAKSGDIRSGGRAVADRRAGIVSRPAATPAISQSEALSLFAITAPGLEEITAAELRSRVVVAPVVEPGGVAFSGTLTDVYEANLWLRTASRVVIRIASFHASEFHELERRAKRIPWSRYIGVPARVRFRVTCRKSRLYHSDAVAERLGRVIASSHGLAGGFAVATADETTGGEDAQEGDDAQLFIVRLVHDEVTISADTSGTLLHRRGYRQAVAKAPLRETLAAAMLIGSGWDGTTPFADPMCGSGTLPIEAALLARRMAPGIDHVAGASRRFAFMGWAGFDDAAWQQRIATAIAGALPRAPIPILGADRDAGAIAAAVANAARAGVSADVELREQSISALALPPGPGWVVSNPPYGVRLGESAPLRNLYAQLGKMMRDRGPGWTLALLTADRALERQVGIPLRETFRTSNGGIPVRLVQGIVPGPR